MSERTLKEKIQDEMVRDHDKEEIVEYVLEKLRERGKYNLLDDQELKEKIEEKYHELKEKEK